MIIRNILVDGWGEGEGQEFFDLEAQQKIEPIEMKPLLPKFEYLRKAA